MVKGRILDVEFLILNEGEITKLGDECLMNAFKKSKIYLDGFVYIFANPWSVLRDYKFTNM